ncbi:MAG: hypothetical protein IPL28_07465 [Chloroflexi bacterium]|nr:hypothetical protein [Chloroflexota bacterium]
MINTPPPLTVAQTRAFAGIDPTGSGLWTSSAIGGAMPSPHDAWQQTAVEATATGAKISVFVEADFTGTGFAAHLDAWFDKAELTTSAPPTNTPVPQPTSPPVVVQPTPCLPRPHQRPCPRKPRAQPDPHPPHPHPNRWLHLHQRFWRYQCQRLA